MSSKRKTYSAEFKTKVALEAIRGELTANQIAARYKVELDWLKKIWTAPLKRNGR